MKKKKIPCQRVEWHVARTDQIAAFGYVSRTYQIAEYGQVSPTDQITTLGYVSRTNHITAFGYLAPITAFRVCIWHQSYHNFLANYFMESSGCAERMTLTINFGLILISVMVCGLRESVVD